MRSLYPKKSNAEPNFPASPKKRLALIIALSALACLLLIYIIIQIAGPKVSNAAALAAIDNTFAASSYRFTTVSTVFVSGEARLFCDLTGEKSAENRHITGELLGTTIDVYYVDGAIYQQSSLDKSWRKIAEANLEQAAKLIGEIEPQSNFQYAEPGEMTYVGKENIDGQKCHKLTFYPTLANTWIEQHFSNICYTIWLDKSAEYLVQSEISAVSAENPEVSLMIQNRFSNFNEPLEIKAPL